MVSPELFDVAPTAPGHAGIGSRDRAVCVPGAEARAAWLRGGRVPAGWGSGCTQGWANPLDSTRERGCVDNRHTIHYTAPEMLRRGLRRRRSTGLLVGVVVVFLGQQLGEFWHFATTVHRVCPEHGELIHAEGGGHGVAGVLASGGILGAMAGSPGAAHDHHGCPLGLGERRGLDATAAGVTVTVAPWGQLPVGAVLPPPRHHPLRFAPKASPPA